MFATSWSSVKLSRNGHRVRQDELGDPDAQGEEEEGQRDPRPDGTPLGGGQAGATNAQTW